MVGVKDLLRSNEVEDERIGSGGRRKGIEREREFYSSIGTEEMMMPYLHGGVGMYGK